MPVPEPLFSVGLLRSAYWISCPDFQNPSPSCGKKLKRAHSFHYQLQTTVMKKTLFWLFHIFLLWLFVDLRKNLLYSKRGIRRWVCSNKNVKSPNFRKHTSQRPFGGKKMSRKLWNVYILTTTIVKEQDSWSLTNKPRAQPRPGCTSSHLSRLHKEGLPPQDIMSEQS